MKLILALLVVSISAFSQQLPNLPQVWLSTTYPPLTGKSISVPAGGDLQSAIDSANLGDEIVLQAGATYVGNFNLPAKSGSGWLVIRSSNLSSMPAGTRIGPANVSDLATLQTPNSSPVFSNDLLDSEAERAAQFYRFSGLEITVTPDSTLVWNLIDIDDAYSLDTAGMPHDITVDRCWVHGNSNPLMIRGLWLGGARMAVVDSYFSDFHDTVYETQAIYGEDAPGPYKIQNNYLEAAGENLMFGGPTAPNVIPSDVVIRYNYFSKPLAWQSSSFVIKNLLEFKNIQRAVVDSNVLENCWPQAQTGFAVVMIPRSNFGAAPWVLEQDVTFTRNVIRNVGGGMNIAGIDDECPVGCVESHRVLIKNNLFYGITENLGAPGYVLQMGDLHEFTVNHNTMQATCAPNMCWTQFVVTYPTTNEWFENNILNQDVGGQSISGPASLFDTLPQIVSSNSGNLLANNLVYGPGYNTGLTQNQIDTEWLPFAPVTYFATDETQVGFTDYANNNFALLPTSPYIGLGNDGKTPGYDPTLINIARITSGSPLQ